LGKSGFTVIDEGLLTGIQALTEATGINNSSAVAGVFFDPNTFRSFQLTQGALQHLGVPGQGDTFAGGISDDNSVVGSYDDINFATHGFVFSRGAFHTVDFPGTDFNFTLGVNTAGQIVGEYFDDAGSTHSFLAVPRSDDALETTSTIMSTVRQPLTTHSCAGDDWDKHPERLRHLMPCKVAPKH
jgi:uncharacterized membrane protein